MFDPVSLGIMGVSTGLGFLGSKAKEKEARRIEKMNSELSALDSQFAPFVKTAAIKQAQPEAGPGGFAGALQGGLSGFNQAQLVNKAMGAKNIYSDILNGSPEKVAKAMNLEEIDLGPGDGFAVKPSKFAGLLGQSSGRRMSP